ncbi:MAG: VWA domain-containing protein [Candidatus Riflebacteria bacterium]|nr:VWA domain-containing protein [Candidatus Riflebacteria bacterium]
MSNDNSLQSPAKAVTFGNVTIGIRRPNWVNRLVGQLVILVGDCSLSMSGAKALDASKARQELVAELARSENKDAFEVAMIDFHGSAALTRDVTKATALANDVPQLTVDRFSSGTDITAGLSTALAVLARAAGTEKAYLRPVVIIFSDGMHNGPVAPDDVARCLRERADLVTVAYGTDADELGLRQLATSEQHFYRCTDGRALRQFLAAVGATLTGTMSQRRDATGALAGLGQ